MPALLREWAVAEVHALPDDGNRHEVIDGELFGMPASAWKHQAAVHRLSIVLDAFVGRLRLGYVLSAPADSRIEVMSERLIWQLEGATEAFDLDLEWYFRVVLEG